MPASKIARWLPSLLVLPLVACGAEEAPTARTVTTQVTSTATVTSTVTATPTPTVTSAPTPPAPSASTSQAAGGDRTDELIAANRRQPWVRYVVQALQDEPGHMVVSTSIVDPRGEDGSAEAKAAVAICKATVALLKQGGVTTPGVRVMEADDSTFAYISPATGGACIEA